MIRRVLPTLVAATASLWLAFHALIHVVLTTLGAPCP